MNTCLVRTSVQDGWKLSFHGVALLALFLGLSAVGCAGRDIYPDALSDSKVLVRQWTLASRYWGETSEAGDRGFESSNPILVGPSLVFGSQGKGLISIYPDTQQLRWVLPISGGVVSELTQSQGQIYFGGGDGFLYSVDSETGRVNWRYELRNPYVSRPTVDGGRVFVTSSDDTIWAFDAGTGKWLWHYRRRSGANSTIRGAAMPLADGTDIIAGLSDGFLVVLNREDGQLKWERKLSSGIKFIDVDAPAVLEKDVLYVPSYDGALYALKRKGGEVLWKVDVGGCRSVALDEQRVFLPGSDGTLRAIQKSNGKELWRFDLDSGVPTSIAQTDQYLVFGSSHQYLYALDRTTGQLVWRYHSGYGSGFSTAPLVDAQKKQLYVLSGGGNLLSFSFRTQPKARPRGRVDGYEFEVNP